MLENVRVFDGDRASVGPMTVMFGRRVQWMGPAGEAPISGDGPIVDGRDQWLMPGLIDCHIHLEKAPDAYASRGVTTLRDVGNSLALTDTIRASVGPWGAPWAGRVLRCGPLLDGPEPMWPSHSISIEEPDEVDAVIEQLAAAAVDAVKTYMYLSEPAHRRVVEVAHQYGLPVISHLGDVAASTASAFGLDGIEHVTQGLYNDVVPPALRRKAVDRHRLGIAPFWADIMAGWANSDPSSSPASDALGQLAASGVALTPTLAVINEMLDLGGSQPSGITPEDGSLNRLTSGWTLDDFSRARDGVAVLQATVGLFFRLGGTVLAGTDNSGDLHDELQLLTTAGLSAIDALRAATSAAAKSLQILDRAGRVAPGMPADLILTTMTELGIPRVDQISHVWVDGVAVREPTSREKR